MAKRTPVPVGPGKFDLNRCNESPLRGEKPDFWPVSKFNTGSLPLRGILPVTTVKANVSQMALRERTDTESLEWKRYSVGYSVNSMTALCH